LLYLTHSLFSPFASNGEITAVLAEKLATMDFYGHPTGIRSVAISSDDRLACTVSKNVTKIWNVASRTCIQSLSPGLDSSSKPKGSTYGLCTAFLPGNTHVVVGTREGFLLLIDTAAGDVIFVEEEAHDGAIWSLDVRRPATDDASVTVVTGSADKSVKFWSIELQEEEDVTPGQPMLVHTRTLQMTDDVSNEANGICFHAGQYRQSIFRRFAQNVFKSLRP
jgi:U3 small nucleolar RNA-associated protein 12